MADQTSLMSPVSDFNVAFPAADSTNSTAPALADTTTEPTGGGVLDVGKAGFAYPTLELCPYGQAASGTVTVYVFGWSRIRVGVRPAAGSPDAATYQWHATLLFKALATFSAAAVKGVSGGTVDDTHYYAVTIADPAVGNKNVDCRVYTGGSNGAMAAVGVAGFEKVQVVLERGTATAANCLNRLTSGV